MISDEQIFLANDVKSVHLWLRKRTKEVGYEQAWKEHLSKTDVLERYSKSMKKLAEDYWDKNNQGDRSGFCRINWIISAIQKYYFQGGYVEHVLKEIKKFKEKLPLHPPTKYCLSDKIKLLDVGSCYNPFVKYSFLESYALDLCPASTNVMRGNFLEMNVTRNYTEWYKPNLTDLPETFFDVVVFCLFLEYLPSSKLRLDACKRAWDILKEGGILIIVTPDSKHQSANAQLMKSWKIALAGIGFIRIQIEKLRYLYCMSFRKTLCPLYKELPEYVGWENSSISTPQDTVDYLQGCVEISYEHFDLDLIDEINFLPSES